MTQVDVVFRYGLAPAPQAMPAIGRLREVYGIRQVLLNEAERTVRIEYDSTRLTASVIENLLRRAGIDITEKVALTRPVPPPAPPVAPAA